MVEPRLARAYGTLAGFGFIGGALVLLPSTRLLEPAPAAEAYLLPLLALFTGLVCLAVPWDLIDPRWLHLIGAAAVLETAAAVAVFGQPYVALFFLIGVLVAYVAPDGRTLVFQLALICAALFGPVIYGPEGVRSSLNLALVVAPVLILTTCLFSYLRLKMVHDRRAYHRFAEQTLVLSSQIAGRPLGPLGAVSQPEPLPRLSGLRPPAGALVAVTALLGVPLVTGGLATAGIKLPGAATAPFERVGIELPNQDQDGDQGAAPLPPAAGDTVAEAPRPASSGDRPSRAEPRAGQAGGGEGGGGATGNAGAGASAASPVAPAPAPVPSVVPTGPAAPASPGGGGSGGGSGGGGGGGLRPIQELLNQATGGLQNLLGQLQGGGRK